MQARHLRLGPPPSWGTIIRATLSCSLIGVIAAVGQAAVTPDPNSVVVMPGSVIAVSMLFRRRIRLWAIIVAAILAAILAGLLWLAFNGAHAARWVLVADAGLCPMAAIAIARLLTFLAPATAVASRPADEIPAQQPSTATSAPASDSAEPPLPADLIQRPLQASSAPENKQISDCIG